VARKNKTFGDILAEYVAELRALLEHPDASDELSFRPVFQRFLESAAKALQSEAKATFITEPRRKAFGVPDFKVMRGHSQVGYIETKALGADLDAVMGTDQLERYKQLPNLMLTNYLEFRLIQDGFKTQSVTLCSLSQLQSEGTFDQSAAESLRGLLVTFFAKVLPGVGTAEELAEQMAWRTRRMQEGIQECLTDEDWMSQQLQGQHEAFKQVLIHDLSAEQFADMYAQTIAYGLFTARYQSVQPGRLDTLTNSFTLSSAASLLPRTNPLLRGLFKELAEENMLDPRWRWHASDIADLLGASNMRAIAEDMSRKAGREDPIVHFYETFLKKYDRKIRQTRGVYYTPEPVVSYIIRSVDSLLKDKFGRPDGLADKSVMILDPAVGTGTFLTGVIKHLHHVIAERGQKGTWAGFVRNNLLPRLFGFEILMAPYAIAHLKVGMLLEELGYEFAEHERLHIYLTNTLEKAAQLSDGLVFGFGKTLAQEAAAANQIKAESPIMVIIGNPPYSVHSMNASRVKVNGRWQKTWIGGLIDDYRKVDGKPLGERNPKMIQDDYVKFLRFAQWRIAQTGYGIVSMITNHSYLDNPTFRGMRQNLMQTFDEIYVLDLHGNVRKKEVAPDGSKDENVFDIQQGVAISTLVDAPKGMRTKSAVRHGHLWGRRQEKSDWLNRHQVADTDWTDLEPKTLYYWFVPRKRRFEREYESGWKLSELMPKGSDAMKTAREALVIDTSRRALEKRMSLIRRAEGTDAEIARHFGLKLTDWWDFKDALKSLKSDPQWRDLITPCLYEPFDMRWIYLNHRFIDRPRTALNKHMREPNLCIVSTKQTKEDFSVLATDLICGQHKIVAVYDTSYFHPLYLYHQAENEAIRGGAESETSMKRREPNLAPQFMQDFSGRLKMDFLPDGRGDLEKTFGAEDVFAYIYGVFHSPTYRTRYAEFLKIDFPRVPLTSNADLFRALCQKGQELVDLHLMRDERLTKPSFWGTSYPVSGKHDVTCVDYRGPGDSAPDEDQPLETGRVYINKAQPRKATDAEYFDGVPPEVWEFRIGGYQVLDHWLKERKRHKRSLTIEDIEHFQRVVAVLRETIRLMRQIDDVIEAHGGWPDAFGR